jgi:hypothetical protein
MLNKDFIVTNTKLNPWNQPSVRSHLLTLLEQGARYERERDINQVDGRIVSTLNIDSITHEEFLQDKDLNLLLQEIKVELLHASTTLMGEE